MVGDVYRRRLDALEQTWQAWAELGRGLTEQQWSTPTRCPGWDVACVYAHVSMFPLEMSVPPPPAPVDQPVGLPVTAVQLLGQYNTPTGVATTMAPTIADNAVIEAAQHSRAQLVQRFTVHGPRAIQRLRTTAATTVGPWPPSGVLITLVEALRIVLLEATVHLLDLQRALGHSPAVPVAALRGTAQLLAELAPAVELIEAATGRSRHCPFPVLR